MAKIKYDVSNAESRKSPQPGPYLTKVHSMKDRTPDGKNDIEVVLEITAGEFKTSRLWTYLNLGEQSEWKLREFTDALGLKPKGTLDTDKLVGKQVGVIVTADSYQGDYRARVNKFVSPDDLEEPDDDDGEDLDDDDEAPVPAPKGKKGKAAAAKAVTDDDDDDDDDDEDGEDYSSMSLKELRELIDEREIEASKADRKDKDRLIELLEEDDEDSDDDDEDDEDESDEDEDESDDDDDEDEDEDYSTWSLDELKEELESRGLNVKGKKASLISRLEKDDASDSKPF